MVAEILELIVEIGGKEWEWKIGKECHWGCLMGKITAGGGGQLGDG